MKRLLIAWVAVASTSTVAQTLPPDHPPLAPKPSSGKPAAPAEGGLQTAEELLQQLDQAEGLKGREKTFQVATSLGKLYYGNGRFAEAVAFLREAVEKGEPARTLYVEQSKRARAKKLDLPTPQDAGCAPDPARPFEAQVAHAEARARANDAGAAATCARLALEPVLEVRQTLAGALINTGDADGARKVLEGTLEAVADHPDALWAHAALLLETKGDDAASLARAKAEWERYLTLRPSSPRSDWTKKLIGQADAAIKAGGLSRLEEQRVAKARTQVASAAGQPPHATGAGMLAPVSPEAMEAIQNTERTPELVQGLAQLVDEAEEHLSKGRFQEALDNYKRVVPFEPENARARAGMAWSLISLNRQPMADNIWKVAVGSDPASVDALGDTLKRKGDAAGARSLWTKLAQTDPSYAERSGLRARLEK